MHLMFDNASKGENEPTGADGLLFGGMMHGAGRGIRLSENVGYSSRRHVASSKRCHATALQRRACADDARGIRMGAKTPGLSPGF